MPTAFRDRSEAGQRLARRLERYAGLADTIVLALPRGGVPVAYEVARALRAPLDVFVVRKLGMPSEEELAMGAVASGGIYVLNEEVVQNLMVPSRLIAAVAGCELREVARQERAYRGDRPAPKVRGRTVIVVDDGLATGSTMRAAVAALRRLRPARIVVAVPVAAPAACAELEKRADHCICEMTPEPFQAVGLWYEDFAPTTDDEVRDLLARSASPTTSGIDTDPEPDGDRAVAIGSRGRAE